jgi:hypothetical protein
MDFDFETLYNSYSKDELYEILKNQDDYQPEAVSAAKKIAKEKGWLSSINFELNILEEESNKKRQEQEKINSIVNDQCFLEINKNHIIETDSILSENDIEYYFIEKTT